MPLSSFWANIASATNDASARSSAESGPKPEPEPELELKPIPSTITAATDDTFASGDSLSSADDEMLAALAGTESEESLQEYFRQMRSKVDETHENSAATLDGINALGQQGGKILDTVEESQEEYLLALEEAKSDILAALEKATCPEEAKNLQRLLDEKTAIISKMKSTLVQIRGEKMVVDEENRKLRAQIGVLTGKKAPRSRSTLANVPTNHPPAATKRQEAAKRLFVDRHSEAARQEAEELKRANGGILP